MVLIRTEMPHGRYRENVSPEEIFKRDAPGTLELAKQQLREGKKAFEDAQNMKRVPDTALAHMVLEIPEVIHARIPPRRLVGKEARKTYCEIWHLYPDMRRRKGNCPFCGRA